MKLSTSLYKTWIILMAIGALYLILKVLSDVHLLWWDYIILVIVAGSSIALKILKPN